MCLKSGRVGKGGSGFGQKGGGVGIHPKPQAFVGETSLVQEGVGG